MKLAGNPPGDPGLDRREVFGPELMPARPQILGGGGTDNPHVDPQRTRIAVLGAAGDDVIVSPRRFRRPRKLAGRGALVHQRFQGQPATVPKEIGHQVLGKGFDQVLLVGIASQIAHRRNRHSNAR